MKKLTQLVFTLLICAFTLNSCSKGSGPEPDPSNPTNPGDPSDPGGYEFDPSNFVVTVTEVEYEEGDGSVYVNYHVRNKSTTQAYDVSNDDDWVILFTIKATDGYEYSDDVLVFSVEAESDYEHGIPITVSTGKTIDVSTLTFEIVQEED